MKEYIEKAYVLVEAMPYFKHFNGKTFVIKYGGSIMRDELLKRKLMGTRPESSGRRWRRPPGYFAMACAGVAPFRTASVRAMIRPFGSAPAEDACAAEALAEDPELKIRRVQPALISLITYLRQTVPTTSARRKCPSES